MAVFVAWDTTAFNNFTTAAGSTEEDGVGSLWSLDGKLIEGVYCASSLDNPGPGSLGNVERADLKSWQVEHTGIIGDSSDNNGNLLHSALHAFGEGIERNGDFVGSAVVKSL